MRGVSDATDFDFGFFTGVELALTSSTGFNEVGPNTSGTTSPGAPASDLFDSDATEANLFGHSTNFNAGAPQGSMEYTLTSLSPGNRYDFTFFASRLGVSDNREAEYTIVGETNSTVSLDAANNSDQIVSISGVQPTVSGEVTPSINNTNPDGFFYLGAMEVRAIALEGDYNSDEVVDAADFTLWRDIQNDMVQAGEGADGDGDSVIGSGDYEVWRRNFGATWDTAPGVALNVPGPHSFLLAILMIGFIEAAASRFPSRRCTASCLAFALTLGALAAAPRVTQAESWEEEIQAIEKQIEAADPADRKVLFIGSSSVRLWDLEEYFPDVRPLNCGFGGSQISEVTRFARRLVVRADPNVVVFYAGDNDIASGKTPKQVHHDFQLFVTTLRNAQCNPMIVFISIKPSINRWDLASRMRETNQRIQQTCEKDDHLYFVDVWPAMLNHEERPQENLFADDGLHLNAQGYRVWANLVRPYLQERD